MIFDEDTVKIAFCGVPLAGKTSLIDSILKYEKQAQASYYNFSLEKGREGLQSEPAGERFVFGEILKSNKKILLFACPNNIYFYEEVYEKIFSLCDAVIYVVTTEPNSEDSLEFQYRYFRHHLRAAEKYKKTWTQIPWKFVVNKSDLSSYIPDAFNIPEQLKKESVKTTALKNIGIESLVNYIEQIRHKNPNRNS